jgi:predicted lipoprotein with Yx(FWY)xxD motif
MLISRPSGLLIADASRGGEIVTRRSLSAVPIAVAAVFAFACGSSSTQGGTASQPSATPTPAPVVKTATATVAGQSETILTDAKGMTLYYYTPDKGAGKVTCTGPCLTAWPPVLLPSGVTQPTGGPGITGTLGVLASPNGGQQVTYNGWPLYTWQKDTAPGMTTGQNVGGKWFVVTPTVASNM